MLWWELEGLWVHMHHSPVPVSQPSLAIESIRESISKLQFFLAIFVSVQSQLGTMSL